MPYVVGLGGTSVVLLPLLESNPINDCVINCMLILSSHSVANDVLYKMLQKLLGMGGVSDEWIMIEG